MDTFTNYTSSDFNGFKPNAEAEYSFSWNSSAFGMMKDYFDPRKVREFETLEKYNQATGQDKHSVIVAYDIFEGVYPPDPDTPSVIYDAGSLDFRLQAESAAIDAGCILPNVNDDDTGGAPDLGALEYGQPLPVYGPRYSLLQLIGV